MLMDAFRIGVFTIQYQYVLAILSFIITYFIILSILEKQLFIHFYKKHYWDSVLFFIIVYKISPLFTSPSLILQNPLSVLYFSGSKVGIYLGIAVSFLYIIILNYRIKSISYSHIFILFFASVVVYLIVFLGFKTILFTWIV